MSLTASSACSTRALLPSLRWDRSVHLHPTSVSCMPLSHDQQSPLYFPKTPHFSSGYLPPLQILEIILLTLVAITSKDKKKSKPVQITPSFLPSQAQRRHTQLPYVIVLSPLDLETPSSSLSQDKLSHSRAQPFFPPLPPCIGKGHLLSFPVAFPIRVFFYFSAHQSSSLKSSTSAEGNPKGSGNKSLMEIQTSV